MEHDEPPQKSWLTALKNHLLIEPQSMAELTEVLAEAVKDEVLDHDTFKMMEGVLAISKMQVRDIMIPRAQMVVLEEDQSSEVILKIVSDSSHSRFPVIGENKDDVLGIVLAKDLFKIYFRESKIDIHALLRPAHFVPESKRLDNLLQEFRASHNHLAIVVDEYGGIAGLATIEDILEEIVGNIEDELDPTDEQEIVTVGHAHYHLHAHIALDDLNEQLGTHFNDDEVDTIGGLLSHTLGHIPKIGESTIIQNWELTALKTDSRRILQVGLCKKDPELSSEDIVS